MCLFRRDLFISVWESVQLVIHVAGVCLATSLGEGVQSFWWSLVLGVVCQAVLSSISLAEDPSIQLWTDPLKVWLAACRGQGPSVCLPILKIILPVCLKSACLAVVMPSLDMSEWRGVHHSFSGSTHLPVSSAECLTEGGLDTEMN